MRWPCTGTGGTPPARATPSPGASRRSASGWRTRSVSRETVPGTAAAEPCGRRARRRWALPPGPVPAAAEGRGGAPMSRARHLRPARRKRPSRPRAGRVREKAAPPGPTEFDGAARGGVRMCRGSRGAAGRHHRPAAPEQGGGPGRRFPGPPPCPQGGPSAQGGSDELFEVLEEQALRLGAHDLLDDLAALEDVHRRDLHDPVLPGGLRLLVDVELDDADLVA